MIINVLYSFLLYLLYLLNKLLKFPNPCKISICPIPFITNNILYKAKKSPSQSYILFTAIVLYNIPLPINCYTGNTTTKCHSGSMGDNRDLTGDFIRKFLHFLWSLHQILDISNPHEYALSVTKYSILQLPIEAV